MERRIVECRPFPRLLELCHTLTDSSKELNSVRLVNFLWGRQLHNKHFPNHIVFVLLICMWVWICVCWRVLVINQWVHMSLSFNVCICVFLPLFSFVDLYTHINICIYIHIYERMWIYLCFYYAFQCVWRWVLISVWRWAPVIFTLYMFVYMCPSVNVSGDVFLYTFVCDLRYIYI